VEGPGKGKMGMGGLRLGARIVAHSDRRKAEKKWGEETETRSAIRVGNGLH
jgi:hypothetical protein